MLKEKAGVVAGAIWTALNESGALEAKALKKVTKTTDKDLFMGLGWLLREDKIVISETANDFLIALK